VQRVKALRAAVVAASVVAAGALAWTGVGPANAAAAAVPRTVRVLPLGDSITYGVGSSTGSGYRDRLWALAAAGGYGVDFVGSVDTGTTPDPDNEGHRGWTIAQLAAHTDAWIKASRPDVILLHIGTNDEAKPERAPGAPERLSALVDQIRRDAPDATLFVSTIVTSKDPEVAARIADFNARIPGIVAAKHTEKVRLVDEYAAVAPTHLADSVHPDDAGYDEMASAWYLGIRDVLPRGTMIASALNAVRCMSGTPGVGSGAQVELQPCTGASYQRWTRDAGLLRVNGLCLGHAPLRSVGDALRLEPCTGGPDQHWELRGDGTIADAESGRCADVLNARSAPFTPLILWPCQTKPNQLWHNH
jgi:lysophospholipase L1-like esterase